VVTIYGTCKLFIVILLLLLFVITILRGIYNYIPETNHVYWVYNFAPFLVKFM